MFITKAPAKFLKINDGQTRDVLPLRVVGEAIECQRCFVLQRATSELDTKLTTFVCKSCRNDEMSWDFQKRPDGISYTIKAMVYEQPDKHYTTEQSGEGRN